MGIDFIVHSCSKYMGGHSDITAGALCGPADRLRQIVKYDVNLYGSILAPFPAWLLTRGLRTLKVRIDAIAKAADEVAPWVANRPEVERTHHVSLPTFPQRDLFLTIDASRMIYEGAQGSGGGHSDIYKDDVTHLLWAVLHR